MRTQTNLQGEEVKPFRILVPSKSRPGMVAHTVTRDIRGRWACSCEAFTYSKHHTHPEDGCVDGEKACPHIKRIKNLVANRKEEAPGE